MSKFKVGDKVICVDSGGGLPVGEQYVVSQIESIDNNTMLYLEERHPDDSWHDFRFELVNPTQENAEPKEKEMKVDKNFTVGDVVKLVSCYPDGDNKAFELGKLRVGNVYTVIRACEGSDYPL